MCVIYTHIYRNIRFKRVSAFLGMGLLFSFSFQSCQKNINDIEENNNNVQLNSSQFQGVTLNQDGYLMFTTSEIFEQYVDALDEMTDQEINSIE